MIQRILFVVFALVGTLSMATAAEAATCHTLEHPDSAYKNFAPPYSLVTRSNPLLIDIDCGRDVEATIGDSTVDTYVYKYGYQWNGTWKRMELPGARSDSSWIKGPVDVTLNDATDRNYYVAAYVCERNSGSWKCGCKDSSCSSKGWQLQGYKKPTTAPLPSSSSSSGGNTSGNSGGSTSTNPPPKGGFDDIETLSSTATLPSVSECLSRVHNSSWEPRPQNIGENNNTTDLTLDDGVDGVNSGDQSYYLDRIAAVNRANVTGTTDELIQFFSCYWGVDEEITRARAFLESTWDQDVNADIVCRGNGESWGLLQIKNRTPRGCTPPVHDHTYPDVFVSTGNNLNYALAWSTACHRGDMSLWVPNEFMNDPDRRMRECVGLWYSGSWRSGNSAYLDRLDQALRETKWLQSDFPTWPIANRCDGGSCDTLPQD